MIRSTRCSGPKDRNGSRSRVARWGLALAAFVLPACQGGPGELPLDPVDVDGYAAEVHSYVEIGCATLDCHGDPGRPLRLYGEIGLRARADLRDQPMSRSELEDNAYSFRGVDDAPLDENLVLLKPLAEAAGGLAHVGADVWASESDPGYRCVRAWLAGVVGTESEACAEARASVMLPPE